MSTEEACRTTFAGMKAPGFAGVRAHHLDQEQPGCCCQSKNVSPYSDGPVGDDEVLIRILVAPQHMRGKGLPKAASLADAERSGLSVFRKKDVLKENIRKVAEGLVATARAANGSRADKAGVFGVLFVECSVIRNAVLDDEAEPGYGVYDTALEADKSHAEVFQRVHEVELGLVEARRRNLFSKIEDCFVPVDQFMDGLLLDLAPKA